MAGGLNTIANLLGKVNASNALVVTLSGGTASATVFLAGDGTAAAPSYSFTSETGSGLYRNSTSFLAIAVSGNNVLGISQNNGLTIAAANSLLWGSSGISSPDVILAREAAGHLFQRNGTNAQRLSVANTYTSATNYEAFSVDWQTVANTAIIGTRTAATGSGRPMHIVSQTNIAGDDAAMIRMSRLGFPMIQIGLSNLAGTFATQLTGAGTLIQLASMTNTATSGSFVGVGVTPTYNQSSGSAANTDLLINRTQTAVGSGAQLLIDAQVSTVSKFKVSNTGAVTTGAGTATAGTAPLTVPNGTNLTVAEANTIENDGAAFYGTVDTTNGRRYSDEWNYFRLTGSGTGITSIADFFGANSGIPLVANGIYEIVWYVSLSQATASTSTIFTITTATTALATLTAEYVGTAVAGIGAVGAPQMAGVNVTSSSATALPATGSLANAATHFFTIRAMLQAGNGASNTRLRLTSTAGTATPLINSYFKVRRLSGANCGTYVA